MGEHWIHPGLIVAGDVRADRPPILCYMRIDGEPQLIALAFTVPIRAGETPPSKPFGQDVWHDHSGRVDEESLLADLSELEKSWDSLWKDIGRIVRTETFDRLRLLR
jgi:hypothetical protein